MGDKKVLLHWVQLVLTVENV